MLSRKGYDVLSLLFLVIVVGSNVISYNITNDLLKGSVDEYVATGGKGDFLQMTEEVMASSKYKIAKNISYIGWVFAFFYWIMILILSVELHKKKKVNMPNLIFIIIFAGFAIIYYPVYLRKKLKEVESGS